MIEHEDLSEVTCPKQRYAEPVRIGLRFFGHAPDEELQDHHQLEAKEEDSTPLKVPGIATEIWFEGAGKPELKRSLARLHANIGHPPKEELIRMLAASNSLSSSV